MNASVIGRYAYAASPSPTVIAVDTAAYRSDLPVSFTKQRFGIFERTSAMVGNSDGGGAFSALPFMPLKYRCSVEEGSSAAIVAAVEPPTAVGSATDDDARPPRHPMPPPGETTDEDVDDVDDDVVVIAMARAGRDARAATPRARSAPDASARPAGRVSDDAAISWVDATAGAAGAVTRGARRHDGKRGRVG